MSETLTRSAEDGPAVLRRDTLEVRRSPAPGAEPSPSAEPRSGRPSRREPLALWTAFFAAYAGLGAVLVLHFDSIVLDAMSRVANGSLVVSSADPHLAAVGFVWNPLPSLAAIPLLLCKGVFPELATKAFAGNLLSAACMAACVAVLAGLLRDAGLRRGSRLALAVAFGLTPMIAYYGANGMSEAYLLLAQLVALRALLRWSRTRHWPALVTVGFALGVGYLARYEAAVSAAAASALVAVTVFLTAEGSASARRRAALTDTLLVAAPVGFVVALWAGLSWLIVGEPFAQFSSAYGNSSQVAQQGADAEAAFSLDRVATSTVQLLALQPLLALLVVVSLVIGVRRRQLALLAPSVLLVPVLGFELLAYLTATTFGWLRFYIATIPLAFVLAGLLLAQVRRQPRSAEHRQGYARPARLAVAGLVVAAVVAPFGTQAMAVESDEVAAEEAPQFDLVFHPETAAAERMERRFENEREIAAYLDAQQLPDQSVLVDNATGYAIVLASKRPHQFMVTTDRQFPEALRTLGANDVQFVLAVPNEQLGRSNAVNVAYPSFFADGAGIGTLAREWAANSDQPAWRLYAVK
ncbi:glycosyltransferase family 39 protein [Motilibacter deserti]|uniref:Dolichyl-phosphate-mannose-protein mannosyltransferase n=1 Tax=Motilibacter deserti TaxID=2714956 RepID=A0ABX0GSE9_9ACTN|nr:hypothetical protein [Motilibacter deserti]NHC13433.1 hypothetical protein [Motilibacter deserti]